MVRPKIVALDYDGTLARSNGKVNSEEFIELKRLQTLGVTTIVATGRSLFSADEVMTQDLPIDYFKKVGQTMRLSQ